MVHRQRTDDLNTQVSEGKITEPCGYGFGAQCYVAVFSSRIHTAVSTFARAGCRRHVRDTHHQAARPPAAMGRGRRAALYLLCLSIIQTCVHLSWSGGTHTRPATDGTRGGEGKAGATDELPSTQPSPPPPNNRPVLRLTVGVSERTTSSHLPRTCVSLTESP